jgi:hypothetical protein
MAWSKLFESQKSNAPGIDIFQYYIDKKAIILFIFVIKSKTSDFTLKFRSKIPLRMIILIVNKVILNYFLFL